MDSSRTAAALLVVAAATALVAGPASGQDSRRTGAGGALKALTKQTNKLPARAASAAEERKLSSAATAAKRAWPKRACAAVRKLERYRSVLEGVRIKRRRQATTATEKLRALGPASMDVSRALLASKRTKPCGGGVRPSGLEEAEFSVLQSDANGMRIRVQLPALRFVDAVGGGQMWTKLLLPDTDAPTAVGTPGVPMASDVYGVPQGATVDVEVTKTSSYEIGAVDVFPRQPDPVDEGDRAAAPLFPDTHAPPYSTPPFQIDRDAYDQGGQFPAQAADGVVLGRSRDVTLGNLRVAAAQYEPRSEKLEVLKTVEVTIRFEGGSHEFSDQLDSPWEQSQRRLLGSLLNAGVIRGLVDPPVIHERCGEEMLVITNPATLAQANTFAAARRAAGLRTSVVQTGAIPGGIGTSPAEIQAFIRGRLTAEGCIHPSYVTILGDDELVPTFPGINGIESDLEYSLRDNADELADVALGRIVGDDATGVGNAVAKIINYENSPPGGDWLDKASIAAEFQDDEDPNQREDRTFIMFAERSRAGILDTPVGLSVDRIYATYPIGAVDPLGYRDGTPLPAELRKPTFAWDGDTADIAAAWNDGRYLMVHRDHGAPHGWDNPRFTSEDADALTNGAMLPVVLSINCSSGAFQDDDRSFATQALVNPNGGAAGVFGDTEVSPTDHNTQLAFGFLDALLPRVLAGEGPVDRQRVGDALIWGKTRLAGIWADGGTRAEFYLWHYFGDPSMQMWGGEARPIEVPDPSRFEAEYLDDFPFPPEPDPPPYAVEVTLPVEFNGQAVSLVRDGQVIGKAIAADGRAQIPANFGDGSPTQGDLRVAMEADGAVPVSVPVQGLPVATKLTTTTCPASPHPSQNPMVTSGTLEPGFAGAKIILRYTPPQAQPFERTVTTDANGNWSDKFTPNGGVGQWRIEPRYEGDSAHAASVGQACTVTVN
jgi:hypothetical protein